MNMKKTVTFLLAASMVAGLSACSGQGSNDAGSTTTDDGQKTEARSEAETAAEVMDGGDGMEELTFWHSMDSIFADITEKQISLFNETIGKEKGIHVTGVFQNWPGTDALTAAMSTDDIANMPDVIQLYGESVSIVRDYARTVWAENYISGTEATLKKEDLIPNAVSSHSIDGKMIGVPWGISALMLYYNQDYLDQIGAEVPGTIDEMAKILPELVAKTDAEYGLNVRVNEFELENWIATQGQGGTYFGNNESGHAGHMTELACDKDGSLEKFLGEWEKVVKSGAYKPIRDSINEEFAQGMYGMVIMTSSRIPTIAGLVDGVFEWGVAPIPVVDAADVGGAYPSGSGLFILDRDNEAKKTAAWEFVQFMASPEAQVMWLEGAGYIPVNLKTAELDGYKLAMEEEPRLQVPSDALMMATEKVVPAYVPNSSTTDSVIKDAMIAFGEGNATKEETMKAIVEGCEQAFTDYYRANPID